MMPGMPTPLGPPPGPPAPGLPPPGLGPVTAPSPNPGNAASGKLKIAGALKLLQASLGDIEMGSALHQKVLKITTELSKEIGNSLPPQALQNQEMMKQIQASGANPMFGAIGGSPPNPGAPPALAPPPAAAAA